MHTPRRDVLVHVGENLRRLRRAAGLSQTGLAEASGISRRTIINLEAGRGHLSPSGPARLAHGPGPGVGHPDPAPPASASAIWAVGWRGRGSRGGSRLLWQDHGPAPA